jgi:hypothetical protein
MTDTLTAATPSQLDGYTLEQHPNQLARRGCWYVRRNATGVLVGWIGLANRTTPDSDGWTAVSFARRDALIAAGTPYSPVWWTGRILWGDDNRSADEALHALHTATDIAWLDRRASTPDHPTLTPHDITAATRRVAIEGWHAPHRDEIWGSA